MKYRTIIMSDAAPVRIIQEDWQVIAHGQHYSFDNEYEFQANEKLEINIRVRRHADGRTLVYGSYEFSTNWAARDDVCHRAGYLYPDALSPDQLICAIKKTGNEIADGADISAVYDTVRDCISELPPLEI